MRRFLSILISGSFLLTPTFTLADNADMAPPSVTPPPVEAEHGMAVSSQHYASQVGADVLKAGGNAIEPGKRPLSSMSPTIVTRNGKIFMVTGSPGGSRIITITLESILNVIDHKMDAQAAVNTPRIHHQWMPDTVYIEEGALSADVRKELEADGYKFTENRPWGTDEAIIISSKNGKRVLYGANDGRSPAGAAIGN